MDKNKKVGSTIIVIILAIIAGTIGKQIARSYFNSSDDIRSQRVLNKVANDLNKSLPMMVDKDTELFTTAGLEGTIVYSYRFVNITADDISSDKILTVLKPQIINSACSIPDTRDAFLAKGVTMRYMYADKNKHHIASFDVKPSDCGL